MRYLKIRRVEHHQPIRAGLHALGEARGVGHEALHPEPRAGELRLVEGRVGRLRRELRKAAKARAKQLAARERARKTK